MVSVLIVNPITNDIILESKSNTFFEDYTILITSNSDVYTNDGILLLKFRKNVIPSDLCQTLYDNLKGVATLQRGRAEASGMRDRYSYVTSKSTGKTIHQLNSKARSGIVGYYDNKSFFGHKYQKNNELCRQTAYTAKHMDRFKKCFPTFSLVDALYQKYLPEHYKRQKDAISCIDSTYRIENTVFTTVTVNKNFRTALHKDKGDYSDGFGILSVVTNTGGEYIGGYTLFPKYGIAVDCRHGDFLAMNVHEWHCNSEKLGDGDRVSFVYYLREKMLKCCPNQTVIVRVV